MKQAQLMFRNEDSDESEEGASSAPEEAGFLSRDRRSSETALVTPHFTSRLGFPPVWGSASHSTAVPPVTKHLFRELQDSLRYRFYDSISTMRSPPYAIISMRHMYCGKLIPKVAGSATRHAVFLVTISVLDSASSTAGICGCNKIQGLSSNCNGQRVLILYDPQDQVNYTLIHDVAPRYQNPCFLVGRLPHNIVSITSATFSAINRIPPIIPFPINIKPTQFELLPYEHKRAWCS